MCDCGFMHKFCPTFPSMDIVEAVYEFRHGGGSVFNICCSRSSSRRVRPKARIRIDDPHKNPNNYIVFLPFRKTWVFPFWAYYPHCFSIRCCIDFKTILDNCSYHFSTILFGYGKDVDQWCNERRKNATWWKLDPKILYIICKKAVGTWAGPGGLSG